MRERISIILLFLLACGSVWAQGSQQIDGLTELLTVGSGGVTASHLVQLDTSNPSEIIAASTGQVYGIAVSTVSATGTVQVVRIGAWPCVVDTGGATAGHLVIQGTGTVTDCKDSGQTSPSSISSSTQIIGRFRGTASAGSTASVEFFNSVYGTQGTSGALTVGTTAVNSGSNGAVLFDNSALLGALASPTTNGSCDVIFNVTSSTAVNPTCPLPGIPVNAQTGNYSLLYSDRGAEIYESGTTTSTLTLPQITGNTASNFPFVAANYNSGNMTITANAADKINGGSTGGSITVPANYLAFAYQDQSSAPGNWWINIVPTQAVPTGASYNYWMTTGNDGNAVGYYTANTTILSGAVIPNTIPAAGHFIINVATADNTNNSAICLYSKSGTTGTLVASASAKQASTGLVSLAIIGAPVSIPSGVYYAGLISAGTTLSIKGTAYSGTFYSAGSSAIAGGSGGACSSSITANADNWNTGSNPNQIELEIAP